MSGETGTVSAAASGGNLRRGGVKPLRPTVSPSARGGSRRLSVEDMKNGGTVDFSALLPENSAAAAPAGTGPAGTSPAATLRQRYPGSQRRTSARQSANAALSEAERLQKLAEIKKSAEGYETMFVDHLVKQMRPSPLAKTPGQDTFSEIAEQPFREFLSQAGGLGLADTLVGQIARQEGLEQTLQEHPEVMGPNYRPTIPRVLRRPVPGGLTIAPPPPAAAGPAAATPRPPAGLLSAAEINFLYQEAGAQAAEAVPVEAKPVEAESAEAEPT